MFEDWERSEWSVMRWECGGNEGGGVPFFRAMEGYLEREGEGRGWRRWVGKLERYVRMSEWRTLEVLKWGR